MKSFRQASVLAVQRLKELAISLEDKGLEEKKDLLKKCAMTTLNSKLVRGRAEPVRSGGGVKSIVERRGARARGSGRASGWGWSEAR
jgi:hypothetical protein